MKTRKRPLMMAMLAMVFFACSSPQRAFEHENFDEAITKALRKFGKSNERQKAKYVKTLKLAFEEVNHRNLLSISQLKQSNRPENWLRINRLYNQVINRQNKVQPYLRQAEEFGYNIDGILVDYSQDEWESRNRAAEYLYDLAQNNLDKARQGYKSNARLAYDDLNQLGRLFPQYKDIENLFDEAIYLGTDHVLVEVSNRSGALIPERLADRITDFEVERLNDLFHVYYNFYDPSVKYDYSIVINISDLNISPERETLSAYQDEKEVADGFDYVLDVNGNVMKDSLGNDIKVERFRTIQATIQEVQQFKALAISSNLELIDNDGRRVQRSVPISVEAIFDNTACSYTGDRQALSTASRQKMSSNRLPFPSNANLMEDAVELMRPAVLDAIERMKIS